MHPNFNPNPFYAELLCTLAFPPLNSWVGGGGRGVGGEKKSEYFVMSDLQDLSLWANNNMVRSCALLVHKTMVISRSHQGNFKVKPVKNIENIHFLSIPSLSVVQSSTRKD